MKLVYIVLVHGGRAGINEMLGRLGIKSDFVRECG